MRHLVLVGLVIATSAAAIAYVCIQPQYKQCQTCPLATPEPVPPVPSEESGCPKCKSNVVDVVDLNTAYPITTQTPGSTISFEEPPLAKPRAVDVIPTQFDAPVEVAPAPRESVELAPAPRTVK